MRPFRWFFVFLACWFAYPAAAGELRAGVGRADITPAAGTPLGGYGDRKGEGATGVHLSLIHI